MAYIKKNRRLELILTDEEILTKYKYMILKIIRTYSSLVDKDDLFQECCIKLLELRKTWNPYKSDFSTYFYRKLINKCSYLIAKQSGPISLTRRNWYTQKIRTWRVDIDSIQLMANPISDQSQIEEREHREHHNKELMNKLFLSIKYIPDIKVKKRLVKFINGKIKTLNSKDIRIIKDTISKHNINNLNCPL